MSEKITESFIKNDVRGKINEFIGYASANIIGLYGEAQENIVGLADHANLVLSDV